MTDHTLLEASVENSYSKTMIYSGKNNFAPINGKKEFEFFTQI